MPAQTSRDIQLGLNFAEINIDLDITKFYKHIEMTLKDYKHLLYHLVAFSNE